MQRNLKLSLIAFSLTSAYFWFGIWILYYLKFTNYAGIGIIEAAAMLAAVTLEIPTGAFADLIGKKKTLLLSFLFTFAGGVIAALAQNFNYLLISTLVGATGGALRSGTMQFSP